MVVTRFQDAIEHTQALARVCRIPRLLERVWGSHGAAVEGVVNAGVDARLAYHKKPSTVTEYAQTHLHRVFANAEPYFVDGRLVDMIEAAAPHVPLSTRLGARLFRSPFGCLFFERPISGMPARRLFDTAPGEPAYEPAPLSGFAWQANATGVIFVLIYSWAHDPTNTLTHMQGVYVGNIPLSVTPWEFGEHTLGKFIDFHNSKILDPDRSNAERFVISARVAVATLLLMDQILTVVGGVRVDRDTRKRVLRAGWQFEPQVQVVRLRRVEYIRPSGDGVAVDWSCRWLVRSHWRTYNRGLADERTVLIPMYEKGPADKPLKPPSTRVFDVVR